MNIKKIIFFCIFSLGCIFVPFKVFAQSYNRVASVGRSSVMDTSLNYYYTDWKLLSSNSLNIVPIPYSGGNYYHMGSEYSFPINLVGDTSFSGQVKIPVVANTIYNYQLMNGLNQNDFHFGLDKNWGVYNVNFSLTNTPSTWSCLTYSNLGVAHNYCYYTINFQFNTSQALEGSYNLNVGVIDFTGNRSAYYYSGYDSNGNSIEFPVLSQNSGYPNLQPILSMTSSGGSSGGGGTDTSNIENNQQTIINQNNNIINNQQTINDSIEDINDTILDDSHESPNQFLQDMESLSLSDTPITDLLAMPLNMVRAFHSGISGQCSTINLGSWYDKPLIIPCLDIPSIIGGPLWAIIDALFSGFMIYNIAELLIHDFDSLTSADDLFEETYTPRHGKPLGKHTKEVY